MMSPTRAGPAARRFPRLLAVGLVAATLAVAGIGHAVASTGDQAAPTTAGQPAGARPAGQPEGSSTAAYAYRKLNITMQAQQMSNWCWAASGNTVAALYGKYYSQNQFCNLAFNRSMNSSCPNSQATLQNDQTAFRQIGINPGWVYNGYLRYTTVKTEINASRPVLTRIQWQSGGGHMMVIYGYDDANSWVYWGNPWGSSPRYNWASHSYYVSNNSFFWTHSLYQIGM